MVRMKLGRLGSSLSAFLRDERPRGDGWQAKPGEVTANFSIHSGGMVSREGEMRSHLNLESPRLFGHRLFNEVVWLKGTRMLKVLPPVVSVKR